jgi:hypothetical protein
LTAEPAAVLFPALLLNDIAIVATPTALVLEPVAILVAVIFEAAAEKASVSCSSWDEKQRYRWGQHTEVWVST